MLAYLILIWILHFSRLGNLPGCHAVCTRRVVVEGASLAPPEATVKAASIRSRLVAALKVHLQNSSPQAPSIGGEQTGGARWASPTRRRLLASSDNDMDEGGEEAVPPVSPYIPRWSLKCSRKQLPLLVAEYVAGPEAEAAPLLAEIGGSTTAAGEERLLMLRHEAEAWRLIQALWEWIEGEESITDPSEGEAEDARANAAAGGQTALAAFRRRRAVGQWLKRQAKQLVEAELATVSEPCEAMLRLLCALQPAAAAAIAVTLGDVRLATLLAQVRAWLRLPGAQ